MTSILNDILAAMQDPASKHAAMVHLPIALAFIAPLFLLLAGVVPGKRRMGASIAMIAYAVLAVAGLFAIWSGEDAYDAIGDVTPAIGTLAYEHGEMAERVWTWGLVGAVIAAVGLLKKKKQIAIGAVWVGLAFGVFAAGWAGVAAHKGGVLVYEHGVGIPEAIPDDNPDIDPRANYFLRVVRPILVESCMGCHREENLAAGLDLTSINTILEGGERGPVLKPGYPEASMLMTVLRGEHPEVDRMPPGDSGPLSDDQIEAVRLWIEQGAVWGE